MANYITDTEGDTYFSNRLNTSAWDDATTANKNKAISQATAIIDRLNYEGRRTSESQENQFPRYDDSVVPQDIKDACAEIAKSLLDGIDPELELENLNMTNMKYGPVSTTYNRNTVPEHIVHGVPSGVAWRLLKLYLRDAQSVELMRVN